MQTPSINTSVDIKETLKEFFRLLDIKDESESGKVFNPIIITCYRAMLVPKLKKVMDEMESFANEANTS